MIMNYTNLLTNEEKLFICEIITGKKFKEYFIKDEKEFSKIRKGFRAKSLTDQQALSIAVANIDKLYIEMYINTLVGIWLEEIQTNIDNLESNGLTSDDALASTMMDSVFYKNVDLYLKITGKVLDKDARFRLAENMERIKADRAKSAEDSDRICVLEEEKRSLSNQVEILQQRFIEMKEEYEQEKDSLQSQLLEAKEKIAQLESAPASVIADDMDCLMQYDDTDLSVLPAINSDEIISLCGVSTDFSDRKWLIRYADLNHHGQYTIFHKNEDVSPYFENRDKIFYKDGPSEDDFYGIWTWTAIPNEKDPSRDYIESRYNMDIDAIEVFIIADASNLDDMINKLKNGIEYQLHSRKVMFSIYLSKRQYVGVLCSSKELYSANNKTTFAKECNVVPVYEFSGSDIIRLNKTSFYRNAFDVYPLKAHTMRYI